MSHNYEKKYRLVNPIIKGNIDMLHGGSNPLDVAKDVWAKISGYFSNLVPKFNFTLEQLSDGKLHHFEVSEKKDKDDVDYSIIPVEASMSTDTEAKFKVRIDEIANDEKLPGKEIEAEMKGGKRKKKASKKHKKSKKDDSSDSSDSDDSASYYNHKSYKNVLDPIYYYWYDPSIYVASEVYVPTFIAPLKPYVVLTYDYKYVML